MNIRGEEHHQERLPVLGAEEAVGDEADIRVEDGEKVEQVAELEVDDDVDVVGVETVEHGDDALRHLGHLNDWKL